MLDAAICVATVSVPTACLCARTETVCSRSAVATYSRRVVDEAVAGQAALVGKGTAEGSFSFDRVRDAQ